jgi:hypothetical protein
MPATYEPIATTTLGSAASSITFSSIASSWTDLRLVVVATTTNNNWNLELRFNNDATSLYSITTLYGDGSTAGTDTRGTQSLLSWTVGGATSSTIPQLYTADVFSYAGSTFKTTLMQRSEDKNGSGSVGRMVGLYRSTTAISRIDVLATGTTIATGTTATLYGIKNF